MNNVNAVRFVGRELEHSQYFALGLNVAIGILVFNTVLAFDI